MRFYITHDSLNVPYMDSFRNEIDNLKEHYEVIYPYVKEIVESKVLPHRYGNKFRVELPDEEYVYGVFSLSKDQTHLKNLLCFSNPIDFILETPIEGHDIKKYDPEWHSAIMEIKNNFQHYDIDFDSEVMEPEERWIKEI